MKVKADLQQVDPGWVDVSSAWPVTHQQVLGYFCMFPLVCLINQQMLIKQLASLETLLNAFPAAHDVKCVSATWHRVRAETRPFTTPIPCPTENAYGFSWFFLKLSTQWWKHPACVKTRAINTTTYSSPLKHFAFVVPELNIPMRRKSALCGKLMVHIVTLFCSPLLGILCYYCVPSSKKGLSSRLLHVLCDFCGLFFVILSFSLSRGCVPVFFPPCCFLSHLSCK